MAVTSCYCSFGRVCREHCSNLPYKISFQNIEVARDKFLSRENIDITSGLGVDKWNFVCEQFQKRHLIAHKMGIIDEGYVRKTNHSSSLIGRKISVNENDVRTLVSSLRVVVGNLFSGVGRN